MYTQSMLWHVRLRQVLVEYFSEGDIKILCFDLGVDFDNLSGENKGEKIIDLIERLVRLNRILELIDRCNEMRPNIPWDEIREAVIQHEESACKENGKLSASPHSSTSLSQSDRPLLSHKMRLNIVRGAIGLVALITIIVIGYFVTQVIGSTSPSSQLTTLNADKLIARVVRTDSTIHVDGLLDEVAWSEAEPLIYAVHPTKNGSSTATARFLWNDDYLYVGFDVNDTQVETADLSTLWDSDSVSILIHDNGIAEYRQSLGAKSSDGMAYQLKPATTLNEPADTDAGFTVEMKIKWKEDPLVGRRIPTDILSVDHDANPGGKHDPPTIFSKISWDGDGNITTSQASLLLVDKSDNSSD